MKTIEKARESAKFYSSREERLNVLSHAFGLVLSIIGFALLIYQASLLDQGFQANMSKVIFGVSLMLLYSCSVLYHRTEDVILRGRYRTWDHIAIYFLIAGTYTPFCMIALGEGPGWTLLLAVWSIAFVGTIFKIFFTGRFELVSTLAYIGMGWLAILYIEPLRENLPQLGEYWMMAGGVAYTVGGMLYAIKAIPMNHAIFHVFVLIGSFCHYWAVYRFL